MNEKRVPYSRNSSLAALIVLMGAVTLVISFIQRDWGNAIDGLIITITSALWLTAERELDTVIYMIKAIAIEEPSTSAEGLFRFLDNKEESR